jgi:dephospho-CoA kinase
MKKIVALVGMSGAGKTEAVKFFTDKGYQYLRFGQIVLDEAIRLGSVNEETERKVRNGFREKYGMAAIAILNMPKIDALLKNGDVIIDGLYSWEEYKILKEKYNLTVVAILASPKIRYERLTKRKLDLKKDPKAINRSCTKEEAKARDFDQIEKGSKGGPIAMADYFVINEGTKQNLLTQLRKIMS